MSAKSVRAAVLLIGDELLSGRTQDINLQTIAKFLAPLGVQVAEARVVSDAPAEIIAAVNALRATYDYVFTTGGIGPTHDDKTADAIAAAFGARIDVRADARAILEEHYKGAANLNEARLRMARIPDGAVLIANPVSKAPGFQLGNVFVMAGIPAVMQAMLEDVRHRLSGAAPLSSRTVSVYLGEGTIAAGLAALQKQFPDIPLGSYPFSKGGKFGTSLVARGNDQARLGEVAEALQAMVRAAGGEPIVDGEG